MADIVATITKERIVFVANDQGPVLGSSEGGWPTPNVSFNLIYGDTAIVIYVNDFPPQYFNYDGANSIPKIDSVNGVTPTSNSNLLDLILRAAQARGTVAATSTVAANASNVNLLASKIYRNGFVIVNDSAAANMFVKYGDTASATDYTIKLAPGDSWIEGSTYTGQVDAIWSVASGNARLTEITF